MENGIKLMKNKLDNILLEVIRRRRYAKKNEILCLNFHQIAEKFDEKFHSKGTFTSLKKFEEIIKFLKKNYQIISIKDAIYRNKNKIFDVPSACITFDDGDKSIMEIIDLLISENVPASFYINSSYSLKEKNNLFYGINYLSSSKAISDVEIAKCKNMLYILRNTKNSSEYNITKEYLNNFVEKYIEMLPDFFVNYKDMEGVNNSLISFGLHGYEHDRFINLSKNEQLDSLKKNINDLQRLPGYINVFAIPFGREHDWNYDTIESCNMLGLDYLFANGGCNIGDAVGIKRIPADNRNIIFETKIGYYQSK